MRQEIISIPGCQRTVRTYPETPNTVPEPRILATWTRVAIGGAGLAEDMMVPPGRVVFPERSDGNPLFTFTSAQDARAIRGLSTDSAVCNRSRWADPIPAIAWSGPAGVSVLSLRLYVQTAALAWLPVGAGLSVPRNTPVPLYGTEDVAVLRAAGGPLFLLCDGHAAASDGTYTFEVTQAV